MLNYCNFCFKLKQRNLISVGILSFILSIENLKENRFDEHLLMNTVLNMEIEFNKVECLKSFKIK